MAFNPPQQNQPPQYQTPGLFGTQQYPIANGVSAWQVSPSQMNGFGASLHQALFRTSKRVSRAPSMPAPTAPYPLHSPIDQRTSTKPDASRELLAKAITKINTKSSSLPASSGSKTNLETLSGCLISPAGDFEPSGEIPGFLAGVLEEPGVRFALTMEQKRLAELYAGNRGGKCAFLDLLYEQSKDLDGNC